MHSHGDDELPGNWLDKLTHGQPTELGAMAVYCQFRADPASPEDQQSLNDEIKQWDPPRIDVSIAAIVDSF